MVAGRLEVGGRLGFEGEFVGGGDTAGRLPDGGVVVVEEEEKREKCGRSIWGKE